ncbi:hypothetical protein [Tepidibacillus sp. LV47]|uniref:CRISPR-associated endonuclease Cas2 n=1 Tax=Tepidibacillus sp. LV47 TaxID=3398228 RepID=UPI003AB05188
MFWKSLFFFQYKWPERLKDYGLKRIQYSAFFGKLNQNRREELMFRLNDYIILTNGSIIMTNLEDGDFSGIPKLVRDIIYVMQQ